MRFGLLALIITAFSSSAYAQVIVFGTGLARDCYEAAETSRLTANEAIETCTVALTQQTMSRDDRVSTLVNRGILYMRNGNFTSAMNDYNNALDFAPEMGEAYLNIGAAYIYQREYDAALTALNRAIDLETTDIWAAYYNRGIAHEQTGDLTSAYWDFVRSQELNPESELPARQIARFTVEERPVEQPGEPGFR